MKKTSGVQVGYYDYNYYFARRPFFGTYMHVYTIIIRSHTAGVPYDGVTTHRLVTVKVPLAVFYIFLGVVGIIFAVGCLCFNFIYRKNPLVLEIKHAHKYLIL
jgi:hypothetical protein